MACEPEAIDDHIRTHLSHKKYSEAFDLLLAHYQDKVFRLAWSIVGNRALAEDTVQEVFIRIWRALAGYRGLSSLSTWVFAITRNTSLTALRRERKMSTQSLDDERLPLPAGKSTGAPYALDLPELIARLPDKHRQALLLFYMEERSYEEVARLLDLPMGTVKTYLHRARKALAAAAREVNMKAGGR